MKPTFSFIGTGSAFNIERGNTSCFYKNHRSLFLIDCGDSTFKRIIEKDILTDVDDITVLITHTHPDHVGSLADLIFYSYWSMSPIMKTKITVIYPFRTQTDEIMRMMGVPSDIYDIRVLNDDETNGFFLGNDIIIRFTPILETHVPYIVCYGYNIYMKYLNIYYSGDTNTIPEGILHGINVANYDEVYHECCQDDFKNNPHMPITKLDTLISKDSEIRSRISLMHLDNGFDVKQASRLGFEFAQQC